MQFGKAIPHEVHIRPTANKGFIVKVGCGEFAFMNVEHLLTALREYLINPGKKWREYGEAIDRNESGEEEVNRPIREGQGQSEGGDTQHAPT